jgi:hypothetical protein
MRLLVPGIQLAGNEQDSMAAGIQYEERGSIVRAGFTGICQYEFYRCTG